MIKKLRLQQFKNFKDAELVLGPLTILIGTNASGKSNLRDAFRFLHGIARGYTLPEIIGEKYGEGGVLQWRGIRGGHLEVISHGASQFSVEVTFDFEFEGSPSQASYEITVKRNYDKRGRLEVVRETLYHKDRMMYDVSTGQEPNSAGSDQILIKIRSGGNYKKSHLEAFSNHQPVLTRIEDRIRLTHRTDINAQEVVQVARAAMAELISMRFFDLSPDVMRLPSIPGQMVMGDRGENLSSILQAICENPQGQQTLTSWIQELTPMDAQSFDFPLDLTGKVLMTLYEENGQSTSAYSASDGTLRFLGILAALLGPGHAGFCFFEELENGIHPTRLSLLMNLIEQRVKQSDLQIITTTHSPQLLQIISPESLEYASLLYRLEGKTDSKIKRLVEFPEQARQVIFGHSLARLYESGWFENTISFLEGDSEGEEKP